jgi:hypothetical protein
MAFCSSDSPAALRELLPLLVIKLCEDESTPLLLLLKFLKTAYLACKKL